MDEWLVHRFEIIRDAARQACEFVEGLHHDDFIVDLRTNQACALNLLIVGEGSSRIIERYPEMLETHRDFAWKEMTGMRNRIAHGYEDIDLEIVWDTVTNRLPELIAQIDELLS